MATVSGYQRRDAQGRYVKAHNDIDYVFGKLNAAAETVSYEAYNELIKMSYAFLESYKDKQSGQSALPRYTGNLIDSTSIIIAKGTSGRDQKSVHLDKIATVKQHWGNWDDYGIEKSPKKGKWGEEYRIDNIGSIMDVEALSELAVVLHIGIPYALPINEEGTHGKHRRFFDWFAEDFKYDVMMISKKVADTLNYGRGKLMLSGKQRIGHGRV